MMLKRLVLLALMFGILPAGLMGCTPYVVETSSPADLSVNDRNVEGYVDNSFDEVWGASLDVLRSAGIVLIEDKMRGKIEASLENATVRVELEEVDPRTVSLRVRARDGVTFAPNNTLAAQTYRQIVNEAR